MLVQLLPDVQKHCLEDMRTAREAVAWTYGMSEQQYAGLELRT